MANDNHESIIDELVTEGWSRQSFPKAMRALFAEDCDYCADALAHGEIEVKPIVPDAFRVDKQDLLVQVAEVDCSNFLSLMKWCALVDLAWALDQDYYRLELVRIDQFGQRLTFPLCLAGDPEATYPGNSDACARWRRSFADELLAA